MALKVMQANIRNWASKRYTLECDLPNHNSDVILLNETSAVRTEVKLRGYRCIQKCSKLYAGITVLIRNSLPYTNLPTPDPNTIIIKISTSLGPLIVATSYIPPSTELYTNSSTQQDMELQPPVSTDGSPQRSPHRIS